jgi:hypothetical protein
MSFLGFYNMIKISSINTIIYDCYKTEQQDGLSQLIDYIFVYDSMKYGEQLRQIINRVFRVRERKFREKNVDSFMEHAGQHITTTINVGNTMLIMADAIETQSDLTCLIDYMCSWITNPHFIENAFLRNKFKCQF